MVAGQGFVGYMSGCGVAQEKRKNMVVLWERWRGL
jgi:hypothetical protein